jgi:hypothetical protein
MFKFLKKLNVKKGVNYLDLTPFQIAAFDEEEGLVRILIPKFKMAFFQKLIPKNKSPYIKLKLDEIGSATWHAINGQKKVGIIVEELSLHFGEKIHPAEERVTKFMTQLYQYKFIGFNELKKDKK